MLVERVSVAHRVREHGRLYTLDVGFRTLYATGQLSVVGQILLLPITGSGPFTGHFSEYM